MKIALLFGINYVATRQARLRGCWTDVTNMKNFLSSRGYQCTAHTDGKHNNKTTRSGIIEEITRIAKMTHENRVEHVVIHYSGHGSHSKSREERDGQDECLVPSDYQKNGMILDNVINQLLHLFHKDTKVLCLFDCCHSGTIADLKYRYVDEKRTVEHDNKECESHIQMISGCMDSQTSADAHNVMGMRQFSGAMTSCLLTVLSQNSELEKDIFTLVKELRKTLKSKNFTQVPQLCTSYDILSGELFI